MVEQWMSVSRGARTETVEVSEDFSLPDYVPEVRRVLGVVRDATADNGFRDGTTYLQEGNVCYTVFYLGEDGRSRRYRCRRRTVRRCRCRRISPRRTAL